MEVKVKICGITNLEDAMATAGYGASAIGFVFYRKSKRYIHPDRAREISKELPPFLLRVGVFVETPAEEMMVIKEHAMLDRLQVYGETYIDKGELDPSMVIMGHRIKDKEDIKRAKKSKAFPLLDTFQEASYGGSGISFDWGLLRGFDRPFILAGGIDINNIEGALRLKPYAIDIASGCERAPGIKDHKKIEEIMNIVKGYGGES